MPNTKKTVAGVAAMMRGAVPSHRHDHELLLGFAEKVEEANAAEASEIERIVRDAIIDYNGMYPSAPNDDCERELRERAATANAWLKRHGFDEEPFHYPSPTSESEVKR